MNIWSQNKSGLHRLTFFMFVSRFIGSPYRLQLSLKYTWNLNIWNLHNYWLLIACRIIFMECLNVCGGNGPSRVHTTQYTIRVSLHSTFLNQWMKQLDVDVSPPSNIPYVLGWPWHMCPVTLTHMTLISNNTSKTVKWDLKGDMKVFFLTWWPWPSGSTSGSSTIMLWPHFMALSAIGLVIWIFS